MPSSVVGIVGSADAFPVLDPADPVQFDIVEDQGVGAEAAGYRCGAARIGVGQVAQPGCVIVGAEVDRAVDDAAAVPDEGVVAETHHAIAADRAAGHRYAVGAAADADVAADGAARENDRVVAEAGDEVAVDAAAGHVEIILSGYVDRPADAAAGRDPGGVEEIDDAPIAHGEGVEPSPWLGEPIRRRSC